MGTQDWANKAVSQLESLENERVAIHEARASSIDGDNERRLDTIRKEVDELYTKLNTEAEQIAGQVEAPLPSSRGSMESSLATSSPAPAPSRAPSLPPPAPLPNRKERRNIDTVVVEHPAQAEIASNLKLSSAQDDSPASAGMEDGWIEDDRLQLSGALKALEISQEEKTKAFEDASKTLEGQAQELAQLKAQAQAARLALQRFEASQASVESQLQAAQERLAQRREQEKRVRTERAAMEARVRTEFRLLVGLDKVRERIASVETTLQSAVSSAEQERARLSTSVDQALDAAERATRQAEEMRDAAERAHHRAQQAIAHAQDVETRSEVREQELARVIDGLEGQMAGLNHEKSSIEAQLQDLRADGVQGPGLKASASLLEQGQVPSQAKAKNSNEPKPPKEGPLELQN